jgi:Ca2+-binding EF-hand superfamily protein
VFKHSYLFLAAVASLCASAYGQILNDEKGDLYSLILAPIDLTDAGRLMTVCDPDEDGFIDGSEQARLRWKDGIEEFDLNRDGKLTHLELAVRFAKIRSDAGVEQTHVNNAKIFLRRHDKNGNGQLDSEEIAGGWPSDPEEFDADRDGNISLGEIAKRFAYMAGLRREMGIEQVDQVTAIRTVRKFDQDKDQQLSEDEQSGAFLPLPAKDFDEDNDGRLSIMEIATMLAKNRRDLGMSKSDLAKVRSVFERYDQNADGKIDEAEFASASFAGAGGVNPLSELDQNQDGQLTQLEVQQTMAQSRKSLGFNDDHLAEARKLMTRHDKNRSTFIEEAELYDEPGTGQLQKLVLRRADQDGDQRVSLLELAKYLADQERKE